MANTYTPRFGAAPSDDNTSRVLTNTYDEPAYAATIALVPNASRVIYNFKQLTGNATVNLTVTNCKVGDEIICTFNADSGGARTVTFGTGFSVSAATLAVTASKKGSLRAVYDGVTFVEVGRAVTV